MSTERDKRIVALRESGWSIAEIALKEGLSASHVARQFARHKPGLGDRMVPVELSIVTARRVYELLGVWPSPQTARTIYSNLSKIMVIKGSRRMIAELGAWLESEEIKKHTDK